MCKTGLCFPLVPIYRLIPLASNKLNTIYKDIHRHVNLYLKMAMKMLHRIRFWSQTDKICSSSRVFWIQIFLYLLSFSSRRSLHEDPDLILTHWYSNACFELRMIVRQLIEIAYQITSAHIQIPIRNLICLKCEPEVVCLYLLSLLHNYYGCSLFQSAQLFLCTH